MGKVNIRKGRLEQEELLFMFSGVQSIDFLQAR